MPPAARARGVAASLPHCRQLFGLVFGAERLGELKQVTVHHLIEFIQRQVDAVVGDPILPKIILDTDRFNAATLLHQTLGAACLALAQLHPLRRPSCSARCQQQDRASGRKAVGG